MRVKIPAPHAEVMGPYVQAALQDAGVRGEELDVILTGTGPGPFTGLRAGIVTARTLGFAWSVPVYGMMSLTALAERAVSGAATGKLAKSPGRKTQNERSLLLILSKVLNCSYSPTRAAAKSTQPATV